MTGTERKRALALDTPPTSSLHDNTVRLGLLDEHGFVREGELGSSEPPTQTVFCQIVNATWINVYRS